MEEQEALDLIKPYSELLSEAIFEAMELVVTNTTPRVGKALTSRSRSSFLNDMIYDCLRSKLGHTSARVEKIRGNLGVMINGVLIRFKKLNDKLLPMNYPTIQQSSLRQTGFLEKMGVSPLEVLVLGYKPDDLISKIQRIVLFPNKNLPVKMWQIPLYNHIDAFQTNIFSTADVHIGMRENIRTGTDDTTVSLEQLNEPVQQFRLRPKKLDQQSTGTDGD